MISIVMPVYNSEAYLERTLKSFDAQIYRDFELVIVDDASCDNSVSIIQNFIEKSKIDICFLQLPKHAGASVARNQGFQYAQGELICFVDSDDIVSPLFLQNFCETYKKETFDACFCNYEVMDERENVVHKHAIENFYPTNGQVSVRWNYLTGKTALCHCAATYRRRFLIDQQLGYVENCQCAEDTEFVCKVIFASRKTVFINKVLYTYCRHIPSLTHSGPDDRILDAYRAMLRAQQALPFLWQGLFWCTKRARIHGFILDFFLQANIPVPRHYSTWWDQLWGLLCSSLFSTNKAKHRKVLKLFISGQIKYNEDTTS